ncbi:hypothetical protein ACRASX_11155 [Flavobacterium sp. TMP13]|nr:hypothetical protein [Flavobacterium sp. TAB 87]
MTLNKKKPKPPELSETLAEMNYRQKQEAKELAAKFKNIKPTKYLLKC